MLFFLCENIHKVTFIHRKLFLMFTETLGKGTEANNESVISRNEIENKLSSSMFNRAIQITLWTESRDSCWEKNHIQRPKCYLEHVRTYTYLKWSIYCSAFHLNCGTQPCKLEKTQLFKHFLEGALHACINTPNHILPF